VKIKKNYSKEKEQQGICFIWVSTDIWTVFKYTKLTKQPEWRVKGKTPFKAKASQLL